MMIYVCKHEGFNATIIMHLYKIEFSYVRFEELGYEEEGGSVGVRSSVREGAKTKVFGVRSDRPCRTWVLTMVLAAT